MNNRSELWAFRISSQQPDASGMAGNKGEGAAAALLVQQRMLLLQANFFACLLQIENL